MGTALRWSGKETKGHRENISPARTCSTEELALSKGSLGEKPLRLPPTSAKWRDFGMLAEQVSVNQKGHKPRDQDYSVLS